MRPQQILSRLIVAVLCLQLFGNALLLRKSVDVSSKRNLFPIVDFLFQPGGRFHLTSLDFVSKKPIPESQLRNTTIRITDYDDWARFSRYVVDTDADPCVAHDVSLATFVDVDLKTLMDYLKGNKNSAWTAQIKRGSRYEVSVFNCATISQDYVPFSFTFNGALVNVQPNGKETHLDQGQSPQIYIYLVFGFILWPLACIPWWWNGWAYRHDRFKIFDLLVWTPLLLHARGLLCYWRVRYFSDNGKDSLYLYVPLLIVHLIWMILKANTRILISKGWCITRLKLLRVEWRTLVGTSVFVAMADTFQLAVGGGSNVALLTLMSLFYMYVWLNFRHQRFILGTFLHDLHQQNAVEEVVSVYTAKNEMLEQLRKAVVGFGITTLLFTTFTYLFGLSVPSFILVLVYETLQFAEACAVGYLLRLREVKVINLLPNGEPEDHKKSQ